jgi:hypothetical protein
LSKALETGIGETIKVMMLVYDTSMAPGSAVELAKPISAAHRGC